MKWNILELGTCRYRVARLIRPNAAAVEDWGEAGIPDLSVSEYAEQTDKRAWRLRIKIEEGDLFILNTRAWYHRTELEASSDISVSIARDFYLPAEPIFVDKDYAQGDVLIEEVELPDDIPRSDDPNCALAEVVNYDEEDDDEEGVIVLVALSNIRKGEPLSIAIEDEGASDDDGGSDNGDDRCNAPDSVDPRAICSRNIKKGEILLKNEEIPEELFCSDEFNCAVEEIGNDVVLRALRDIAQGDVMSVAPMEGIEYDEVEVDVETGELVA